MTADTARDAKAQAWFEYVNGRPRPPRASTPYQEVGSAGFCFADVWSRPGLDTRARRFLTLACAWMTGVEKPIWAHMYGALKTGDVTYEEMQEAILHFAVYAGMPLASRLEPTLEEVWKQVQADGGPVKRRPPAGD